LREELPTQAPRVNGVRAPVELQGRRPTPVAAVRYGGEEVDDRCDGEGRRLAFGARRDVGRVRWGGEELAPDATWGGRDGGGTCEKEDKRRKRRVQATYRNTVLGHIFSSRWD
jgi:hypothetical protein